MFNNEEHIEEIEERPLYQGQARFEDLREEEQEPEQPQEAQAGAEPVEAEEHLDAEEQTYKKRYGDLRTHLNSVVERHRAEMQQMQEQINKLSQKEFKLPKTEEELAEFAQKFPDVYKVIESVSLKYANEATKTLEKEVLSVREQARMAAREKAEAQLMKLHPDFDEIRQDPAFHEWAKTQPAFIQDALYKNDTDYMAASRAIDLYKADTGVSKKRKPKSDKAKEAAAMVTTSRGTDPAAANSGDVVRESEVARMSAVEYEANEERIMKAIRSGKFVYDISGAAR